MDSARPSIRILVALLLMVQVALPATAALEHGPRPVSAHEAHVSGEGERGCEPVHGELECLICRVLASHPVGASVPVPAPLGTDVGVVASADWTTPSLDILPASHPARAPPVF